MRNPDLGNSGLTDQVFSEEGLILFVPANRKRNINTSRILYFENMEQAESYIEATTRPKGLKFLKIEDLNEEDRIQITEDNEGNLRVKDLNNPDIISLLQKKKLREYSSLQRIHDRADLIIATFCGFMIGSSTAASIFFSQPALVILIVNSIAAPTVLTCSCLVGLPVAGGVALGYGALKLYSLFSPKKMNSSTTASNVTLSKLMLIPLGVKICGIALIVGVTLMSFGSVPANVFLATALVVIPFLVFRLINKIANDPEQSSHLLKTAAP